MQKGDLLHPSSRQAGDKVSQTMQIVGEVGAN